MCGSSPSRVAICCPVWCPPSSITTRRPEPIRGTTPRTVGPPDRRCDFDSLALDGPGGRVDVNAIEADSIAEIALPHLEAATPEDSDLDPAPLRCRSLSHPQG